MVGAYAWVLPPRGFPRAPGRRQMQWVTREHPHTDRVACPWLIRKFIDRDAQIVYLSADEVLPYAQRTGAISFDVKGAQYTHRDGLCSFEVLVEEYSPVSYTHLT